MGKKSACEPVEKRSSAMSATRVRAAPTGRQGPGDVACFPGRPGFFSIFCPCLVSSFVIRTKHRPRGAVGSLSREERLPMAQFLFVYRRDGDAVANMTPEEMQQNMQKWGKWFAEGMEKGWLISPGDGLTSEGRVVSAKVVTDGP